MDIGCEPSNSRILKHLLSCLSKNKHSHMLKYSNGNKTEFEIKLTNKKNPIWKEKDISLFKAMDDLSSKPRKKANYDEECKGRFKANLAKWCETGFLKYLGKRKENPVTIVKYRILRYPGDKPAKAKSKGKRNNMVNMDKTVVNMTGINGNLIVHYNGNISRSTDYSDNSMQGRCVDDTTYDNTGVNENFIVHYNGSISPSTDYSDNSMQGRCVNDTTYDNIVTIGNVVIPCNGNISPSTDYSDKQGRYADDIMYNCTKGFDDEEKMIRLEDPVFSSAWEKGEKDNTDTIKDSSNFLLSEDDWMEDFSAFS